MEISGHAKQRSAPLTRQRILDVAKQIFARQGYSRTGIREIAAMAKVDSALISRYFGSKAGLFEAALVQDLERNPGNAMHEAKDGFGRRIADHIAKSTFDIQFSVSTLMADDDEAKRIGVKIIEMRLFPEMAKWLGEPNGLERARQIFIIAGGFSLFVRQRQACSDLPPIDGVTLDWFAQSVQAIVDGAHTGK